MDDDKEYIMNKGENENRVIERVTKAINGADKGLEQRKFYEKSQRYNDMKSFTLLSYLYYLNLFFKCII